jgi:hypothetical protein
MLLLSYLAIEMEQHARPVQPSAFSTTSMLLVTPRPH